MSTRHHTISEPQPPLLFDASCQSSSIINLIGYNVHYDKFLEQKMEVLVTLGDHSWLLLEMRRVDDWRVVSTRPDAVGKFMVEYYNGIVWPHYLQNLFMTPNKYSGACVVVRNRWKTWFTAALLSTMVVGGYWELVDFGQIRCRRISTNEQFASISSWFKTRKFIIRL